MATFAVLDPGTLSVVGLKELTQEQYAALNGNPKQDYIRPLVIDPRPTPEASSVAEVGHYVVEPAQVRRTWVVRAKTAAELDAEQQAAERELLRQLIDALATDVADGITAAPATLLAAAQDIQALKQRQRRADRILMWLLRNRV